jgi:hypothetical protein
MRKQSIRSRKVRFGVITVILTVLVVTVTILTNAVFATLAARYMWYSNLNEEQTYGVTEDCFDFVGELLESHTASDVEIIFCDTPENLRADVTKRYVYDTATAIAERYSDRITVSCRDIWTNPGSVRDYTESYNPLTEETVSTFIKSTSVIVVAEGYHRVYEIEEFFIFDGGDTSKVWAYNGEKKLAAGIMRALTPDAPVACLTNNHGEIFYDYELLYLLDDAGYSLAYIDLYNEKIPDNCTLIISYNPNTDLVADNVSEKSELDMLESFLSKDGNSFFVLVENGTPRLPNYESFLAEWGVSFGYHTDAETGKDYRYMVQDSAQSLTSDGYTIYGEPVLRGSSAQMLADLERRVIFKNATAMQAANGFVSNGDGSYTKGNRTLYGLYESGDSAVSWANGNPVSDARALLMTLTKQTNAGATSSVGVISSVRFSSEDFLQSAVFGNTDTLLRVFTLLGQENVPEHMTIKPFTSLDISIVTTSQMLFWTVTLAVGPALIVAAVGVFVLVKRRYA